MANSFHARSNSLPTRPHPVILQCNENLDRLRASHEASSSSSLLSLKLEGLQDLHDCIEKLVQLPLTQEALVHEPQDELLDGSLRLLDACTAARDALLHTKESTHELQSILRRKREGEVEIKTEVKKFLTSRKVVKKAILKTLGNLKGNSNLSSTHYDQQTVALLKEVEMVTLSTFESLLNLISGSTQARPNSWSFVSKLLHIKKVTCSQTVEESEFAQVDAVLQSFALHKKSKFEDIYNLKIQLESLESRIQDLEDGLELLFRRLIKIRVAVLNILNH